MSVGRVVTASLPLALAEKLDEAAARSARSRSWIVRQAVADWIAEEDRRYRLTLEALADVDAGRTLSQEEVEHWRAARRHERAVRQP